MNTLTSLLITQKGLEELNNRTFKQDFKARNILFLLAKEQRSIEEILSKIPFDRQEAFDRIDLLIKGGFVKALNAAGAELAEHPPVQSAPDKTGPSLLLKEGIIVSEAKFLLTNFCVDLFGTQAQALIDPLSDARSVKNVSLCLKNIHETVLRKHPGKMVNLLEIIEEINATSDE